ncbi:hypothetical protein KAU19_08215 [Candidatus Parcubacteria bacterium]|nr:hypothetical protein [Candidatus Parcubacteria bacterium]
MNKKLLLIIVGIILLIGIIGGIWLYLQKGKCGDGICEAGENEKNCPEDYKVEPHPEQSQFGFNVL